MAADQVFQMITGVLPKSLPDCGVNFLRVVIANERVAVLPEVARQFRFLVNGATGVADALVQSAFPMQESELEALKQLLEKRFGRSLRLKVMLLPELIGGVRIEVGDEVLDTSVRARLQQMKMALIT